MELVEGFGCPVRRNASILVPYAKYTALLGVECHSPEICPFLQLLQVTRRDQWSF